MFRVDCVTPIWRTDLDQVVLGARGRWTSVCNLRIVQYGPTPSPTLTLRSSPVEASLSVVVSPLLPLLPLLKPPLLPLRLLSMLTPEDKIPPSADALLPPPSPLSSPKLQINSLDSFDSCWSTWKVNISSTKLGAYKMNNFVNIQVLHFKSC